MLTREKSEQREYEILSEFAAKASETRGRERFEPKCEFRTDFQRDRDRIIHSKALRRLMHKTQVFLAPEKDHFRTRLTHTLEVAQISRSIARALCLNEDLTEAIAMGHDLGHTPFGHNGENALAERHIGGFHHNEQSLRVVDVLEAHDGKRGMNLTFEVRDGIVNHTGPNTPVTLEGQIVKTADRIAYINHDIDDAKDSGVISEGSLPEEAVSVLGRTTRSRIDFLITDMIENSDGKPEILQGEAARSAMNELRNFMFQNVYLSPKVQMDGNLGKIKNVIFGLYDYYETHLFELPSEYLEMVDDFGPEAVIKDHIAGMTDRYAIDLYSKLFVPTGFVHSVE
ncbi:MAG: deoxyguanosinetriphosphate triphosphohydrolase [Clostridiales Family XIII bacterium]|jgi:dGTPase|nr:deoxyguanosinetriphosphate triphosphohydrolase [Clostridiales Family XIII bacterium]